MNTNLKKELVAEIHAERFDVTEDGLYFPRQSVHAGGEYFDRINNGAWEQTPNLITLEGRAHILNVALGGKAKPSDYFLALFSGATAPTELWTAASFASVAAEIVSQTEGYIAATRPLWDPTDTSNGSIDNMDAVATLVIATASTLTVTGAALLTNSTRGGTTGSLVSATKFSADRIFQDGDTYDLGYRLNLTV